VATDVRAPEGQGTRPVLPFDGAHRDCNVIIQFCDRRAVPHGGRKPHQRKRPTSERSTTVVKWAKADFQPDADDDDDFL